MQMSSTTDAFPKSSYATIGAFSNSTCRRLTFSMKHLVSMTVTCLLLSLGTMASASSLSLRVFQCETVKDAKECNESCGLMKGNWSREVKVSQSRGEVVVATKRNGVVDGITGLRQCSIFDDGNWVCPEIAGVNGGKILLGYQMKNNRLFHYSMFSGEMVHFSCAK